jgi:hypothetical protein
MGRSFWVTFHKRIWSPCSLTTVTSKTFSERSVDGLSTRFRRVRRQVQLRQAGDRRRPDRVLQVRTKGGTRGGQVGLAQLQQRQGHLDNFFRFIQHKTFISMFGTP